MNNKTVNVMRRANAHSRQRGFNIIEMMFVAFILSLMATRALPVYQDYTVRAKVTGGIAFIPPVKLRVMEYWISTSTLPTNYNQLGLDPADFSGDGMVLEKLDIVNVPRPGTIELTFDRLEIPSIGDDNTVLFVPTPVNDTLTWACTEGTLVARFRPSQCRG